jgi:DNA-binding transcriptional ArsR family regulator
LASRRGTAKRKRFARIFSALGDETRLRLVSRLAEGEACSIAALTEGAGISRQAVTKHLKVLEEAGLVRAEKRGRLSLVGLLPNPMEEAQSYLIQVSREWNEALARLKSFVEVEA